MTAQFDVFELPGGSWGVDIQSDLIDAADTIVVIPLVTPDEDQRPLRRLNPAVSIDGEQRILMTQRSTAIRRPSPSERIGSLAA